MEEERVEAAHAVAGEIAQGEGERGPEKQQPERGGGKHGGIGARGFGRMRGFIIGNPGEERGGHETEQSDFENGCAPTGAGPAPAGVDRASEESKAGPNAEEAERFAGADRVKAGDESGGGRMIKTTAETSEGDGGHGGWIGVSLGEQEKAEGVDGEAPGEEFFLTEAIGERADEIGGKEIGDHHRGDEKGGAIDVGEAEGRVAHDQEIKREESDVVEMGEGMEDRG